MGCRQERQMAFSPSETSPHLGPEPLGWTQGHLEALRLVCLPEIFTNMTESVMSSEEPPKLSENSAWISDMWMWFECGEQW